MNGLRHALVHPLALALRSIAYHRVRSALLVVALALVAGLPIIVGSLLDAGGEAMTARARSTPLVVGSRGSELDLVIAALYPGTPAPRPFPVGEARRIAAATRGVTVPLHLGFTARKRPVVGTSIDYLALRGLGLAEGRGFTLIGECVVGAAVARDLGLAVGGTIVTDAVDPYNLAGAIPLRLHIVGRLERSGTADDEAVLVDLKTAWIIAGIGHGHQDAATITDPNDLIGSVGGHVVASERLRQVEEVTPESLDGFHFHGDPASFPIHALLVWPADEKDGTLLRGAFQPSDEPLQIVRPIEAIERLLREILRVRRLLEGIVAAIGVATVATAAMVMALAIRLRREELLTMVRLGAARGTVARIIAMEVGLLAAMAAALAGAGWLATLPLRPLVERALLG